MYKSSIRSVWESLRIPNLILFVVTWIINRLNYFLIGEFVNCLVDDFCSWLICSELVTGICVDYLTLLFSIKFLIDVEVIEIHLENIDVSSSIISYQRFFIEVQVSFTHHGVLSDTPPLPPPPPNQEYNTGCCTVPRPCAVLGSATRNTPCVSVCTPIDKLSSSLCCCLPTHFQPKVACHFNTLSLFGEFIHMAQGNFCLGFISDALLYSMVRFSDVNVVSVFILRAGMLQSVFWLGKGLIYESWNFNSGNYLFTTDTK